MRGTDGFLGSTGAERAAILLVAAVTVLLLVPLWPAPEATGPVRMVDEARFQAVVEDFALAHATGAEAEGKPLVRPPPGDVPLLARRFEFWPALELQQGMTYRLNVASVDGVHALAFEGREILLLPGEMHVIELSPSAPGRIRLQCAEYCGLGHNKMTGVLEVR